MLKPLRFAQVKGGPGDKILRKALILVNHLVVEILEIQLLK